MEQLKKLRIARGLLQRQVADAIGVNRTTYVKYETGKSEPDYATLSRLADYFAVTIDYLLGRPQKDPRDMEDDEFYASLTDGERQLLEYYRNASDEARRIVDRIVDDGLDDR